MLRVYEFNRSEKKKIEEEIQLTLHKLIYKRLLHGVHKNRKQEP